MKGISERADQTIRAAFPEGKLFLSSKETAELLGVNVKTLTRMTNSDAIRAVRLGNIRHYTEQDIRDYMAEGPDRDYNTKVVHRGKLIKMRRRGPK